MKGIVLCGTYDSELTSKVLRTYPRIWPAYGIASYTLLRTRVAVQEAKSKKMVLHEKNHQPDGFDMDVDAEDLIVLEADVVEIEVDELLAAGGSEEVDVLECRKEEWPMTASSWSR